MDKNLQDLIADFNEKFEAAQTARNKVISYLEDTCDINRGRIYDITEDEYSWCFGLDVKAIERLCKKS